MLKLRRPPKRLMLPIQLPHPPMQMRVPRANIPHIALKVLDVDGVEANDGGVQSDVCLCDVRGGEEVRG